MPDIPPPDPEDESSRTSADFSHPEDDGEANLCPREDDVGPADVDGATPEKAPVAGGEEEKAIPAATGPPFATSAKTRRKQFWRQSEQTMFMYWSRMGWPRPFDRKAPAEGRKKERGSVKGEMLCMVCGAHI